MNYDLESTLRDTLQEVTSEHRIHETVFIVLKPNGTIKIDTEPIKEEETK